MKTLCVKFQNLLPFLSIAVLSASINAHSEATISDRIREVADQSIVQADTFLNILSRSAGHSSVLQNHLTQHCQGQEQACLIGFYRAFSGAYTTRPFQLYRFQGKFELACTGTRVQIEACERAFYQAAKLTQDLFNEAKGKSEISALKNCSTSADIGTGDVSNFICTHADATSCPTLNSSTPQSPGCYIGIVELAMADDSECRMSWPTLLSRATQYVPGNRAVATGSTPRADDRQSGGNDQGQCVDETGCGDVNPATSP